MIRGAMSGLFLSARQVRRATAKRNQKQLRAKCLGGRCCDARRTIFDLVLEESVISNKHKQAFGRSRYIDAIPKILSVGAVVMLDVRAIDALNNLTQDMVDDGDDGR
ncbi:uncharacterized protein PHALS_08731 [Plasmopara halstedii]|uniref:Uncharacterized protein n=1 Tax=Plasmopara halstedii TaxID=4781 RepID=A0A0P1AE92_PLAHL|nr:uncharacterized protein PHALS_08731 [Plasmopara halstedii]CEG38671.1 hypothetical protein PHALS_08731 [Plasmopara halstedii]|eukprot:XP_024575040.1 hypothetical protein PHALS_08731 [Plasmopara halstedii]